ncbi:MAG: prepilin-type N-terminal cleavage/methylation domain-containing protein [Planctomycetota bacterium]|nr:prepilin-type N-terminal cleavage/methylation domain-containing protein [Planctomycetota bacterium]
MRLLRPARSRRACAGFTMVELAVSAVILSMMMGFILMVQTTGQAAADQTGMQDEADSRLTRALERAANELRSVVDATIWENIASLDAGASQVTFQALESLQNGVATTGPVKRLEVELETSEQLDGIDNDGDGLVDEGALYLTQALGEADEMRVLLCRGVRNTFSGETLDLTDENGNGLVDEGGFHVGREGDRLIIRLALEVARSDGSRVERTGEVSVRIRN